jgi:hypothetical protein
MNLLQLAMQARVLYPKASKAFSTDAFALWARQGLTDFVAECGNVWRKSYTLTFTAGTSSYAMPEDLRKLISIDVPQPTTESLDITTAVRANGIVTITVDTPQQWATGDTVAIADVTDSTFDEAAAEITVIDTTSFLYVQAGSDGSSSGGTATNSWATYPPGTAHDPTELTDDALITYYTATLTTAGRPQYRYWADMTNLVFIPAPSSDYPTATLTYDGKVPEDWGDTDTIPLPDYVGIGLIGYARWQAALSMEPQDEAQGARGLSEYKTAKARYNAGITLARGNKKHDVQE